LCVAVAAEPVPANSPAAADADEVEEQNPEEAAPAEDAAAGPSGDDDDAPKTLAEHLGRTHVVVIHAAVGWLLLIVLLELGAFLVGAADPGSLRLWAVRLTMATLLVAGLTGFLHLSDVAAHGAEVGELLIHRNLEIAATILAACGWFLRELHARRGDRGIAAAALACLTLAAVCAGVGAHLAGVFAHGDL